jgi:hypothetical protein
MKTCLFFSVILLSSSILINQSALTAPLSVEHKIKIHHGEGNSLQASPGYSTIDYLLMSAWDKFDILLTARIHLLNLGKHAGNVGIGYRHSVGKNGVLGANLFYDFRQFQNKPIQQFGMGLEWFSQDFDIRINGYIPMGSCSSFSKVKYKNFSADDFYIEKKSYMALPCIQMELGLPLTQVIYLAAGPYYFPNKHLEEWNGGNAMGGFIRTLISLPRGHTFSGLISYDKIFKGITRGVISLNIALGPTTTSDDLARVRNLRQIPIYRNEIIHVQNKSEKLSETMNPSVIGKEIEEEKEISYTEIIIPEEPQDSDVEGPKKDLNKESLDSKDGSDVKQTPNEEKNKPNKPKGYFFSVADFMSSWDCFPSHIPFLSSTGQSTQTSPAPGFNDSIYVSSTSGASPTPASSVDSTTPPPPSLSPISESPTSGIPAGWTMAGSPDSP